MPKGSPIGRAVDFAGNATNLPVSKGKRPKDLAKWPMTRWASSPWSFERSRAESSQRLFKRYATTGRSRYLVVTVRGRITSPRASLCGGCTLAVGESS